MNVGVRSYNLLPGPPEEISFPELIELAEDLTHGECTPIFDSEPIAFDPAFIPPPDEGSADPELAAQIWTLSAGQEPPAQQIDDVSPLDANPGPALAASLEQTRLDALDDDGVLSAVEAWHRIGAWAKARECEAVATFMNRAEPGNPQASDSAVAQLELALTLTSTGSGRLLELTGELERLPGLHHSLETGAIDELKSRVIAQGTSILNLAAAHQVEKRVLPKAPDQTSGQLRAAVAKAVITADPDAAERRRKKAEKRQRIEVRATDDHTADLCARDLPADEALAADARIAAIARALKSDGQPGTLQFLRARVMIGLLLGTGPAPAGPAPGSGSGGPCLPGDTCPPEDPHHTESSKASERGSAGAPYTLHLTVPLATILGWSEEPGQVSGYGPVSAVTARTINAHSDGRWCLTLLDENGRAARHGHIKPMTVDSHSRAARPYSRAGPGSRENPYGAGARFTVHVTVPSGDLPNPADHRMPSAIRYRWLLTAIRNEFSTKGSAQQTRSGNSSECTGHSIHRTTDHYRPAGSLRHWIEVRDQTCRFPGCRRAAVRCDIDHTESYDKSRLTCGCNLSPLCRKHHLIKQIRGWKLRQPQPGILIWTTPAGREYATHICKVRPAPDLRTTTSAVYRSCLPVLTSARRDRRA